MENKNIIRLEPIKKNNEPTEQENNEVIAKEITVKEQKIDLANKNEFASFGIETHSKKNLNAAKPKKEDNHLSLAQRFEQLEIYAKNKEAKYHIFSEVVKESQLSQEKKDEYLLPASYIDTYLPHSLALTYYDFSEFKSEVDFNVWRDFYNEPIVAGLMSAELNTMVASKGNKIIIDMESRGSVATPELNFLQKIVEKANQNSGKGSGQVLVYQNIDDTHLENAYLKQFDMSEKQIIINKEIE